MGSRFRKNSAPSRSVEPRNPQVRQTPRHLDVRIQAKGTATFSSRVNRLRDIAGGDEG